LGSSTTRAFARLWK